MCDKANDDLIIVVDPCECVKERAREMEGVFANVWCDKDSRCVIGTKRLQLLVVSS